MKRIANIRLTKRTEQGMRMCTLLLFFFIFIEIIKRDGALLWQSIEIDESKKSV